MVKECKNSDTSVCILIGHLIETADMRISTDNIIMFNKCVIKFSMLVYHVISILITFYDCCKGCLPWNRTLPVDSCLLTGVIKGGVGDQKKLSGKNHG